MAANHTGNPSELQRNLSIVAIAAIGSPAASETFVRLLSRAINTTFTRNEDKKLTSVGINWLHTFCKTSPAFPAFFQKAVPDPSKFFLQYNGHVDDIVDISCSGLLRLIPEKDREAFIRPVILRWGPHCKRWTKVPLDQGVSREVLANIHLELLENEDVPRTARDQCLKMFTARRQADIFEQQFEQLRVLDDEQLLRAMYRCARLSPATLLKQSEVNHCLRFIGQMEVVLGRLAILGPMAVAANAIHGMEIPLEETLEAIANRLLLADIVQGMGSLLSLVELSVRFNSYGLFCRYVDDYHDREKAAFVQTYWHWLYPLLQTQESPTAQRINDALKVKLEQQGWRVGTVRKRLMTRQAQVVVDGPKRALIYRPCNLHFSAKKDEEVLFCTSTAAHVRRNIYAATFFKQQTDGSVR